MLDEMDGKQARRTGNSSPLGLLFDHGCDAFNAGISHLCIFVANNASGSEDTPTRIHYIGLRGEFTDKDNRQKVVLATYEARPMPDDIRSTYFS